MADNTSLLQILAGTDPQAANMLAAAQGLQLQGAALDPAFGHNEGPFGALAKTIAGFRGSGAVNSALPQIIAARQAALPELAKIYGTDDPLKTLAGGSYSPQTLAMALSGVNPVNAAEARKAAAEAALARLNVSGFTNAQGGGGVNGAPAGISAPAARGIAPPASGAPGAVNPSILGSGRYPRQEPIQGAGSTGPTTDPIIAGASMSPQQKQQLLTNPQTKAAILQRLRVLAAQHGQQASAGAGMPSLGPTAPPT